MTRIPPEPFGWAGERSQVVSVAAKKVVVVGQGYVGLPLAVRVVEAGHRVVGLDLDELRVKRLAAGESFAEDVPSPRLLAALNSGRYHLSTDYADAAGFDICVITVPTPLKDGAPDLSFVESAAQAVARYLRPNATVILESTTYPCTTEHVVSPILEAHSGLRAGEDFFLGYSPERIDPGNRKWRLENTPKVVSGVDEVSLRQVEEFYGGIVDRTVPVSSPRTAELTKLLENTFRHVNIALVNELAMFCRPLGIDIWEVIDAASTKPFGYMRFLPGPGVGGHCLPIDPSYLSWQVKQALQHEFRFVALANDINSHMPDHVVLRVARGLNTRRKPVNGSQVLVLGLAYKKNTGDIRESPSVAVAQGLQKLGAHVLAVEPHVDPSQLPPDILCVELTEEQVAAADAVVVVTDHDAFDYEMVERVADYVFDACNRCRGGAAERL
ncbi:nucleotide sugar dehydrogenase [Streptomyces formicae]|uniref:Nucleotide sugar dehydrogenase n=1 Tax=Streptomyces formicae TaxID=1616117 RepID=A0ABY3WUK5_9ACTN|nr:nucleotide sugar dehydrogenase [Streptomyces formicae]